MTIGFLTCLSEPRVVYKVFDNSPGSSHTINNAAVYQACSMMTPEFVVNFNAALLKCNYVVTYNNEFGNRCYFIKEHVVLPGGRLVVRCAIDVLYTWREYIGRCTANVIRQETDGIPMLIDTAMQANCRTVVYAHDFDSNCFSSSPGGHCYMLTVIGGAHTQETPQENRGDSND